MPMLTPVPALAKMRNSAAIAHSLKDAGVRVCTHVPGYGGTEVFAELQALMPGTHRFSFHEEVAYSIAHGASLLGARSACLVKSQGFAKAVNSVLSSLSAGTTAGFVTFVFDDKRGAHSDNILDTRELLLGTGIEIAPLAEGAPWYDSVRSAFERSERTRLPVALVVDCEETLKEALPFVPEAVERAQPRFERDPMRHAVCPPTSEYQYGVLAAKRKGIDPDSIPRPSLPNVPDGLPEPIRSVGRKYAPFFDVFKEFKRGRVVTGDASTAAFFAFEPYGCIDMLTYLGGSTPLAIGAWLAGRRDVWAATGDFSFVGAAHLGLIEASLRGIPLKLLIFNNREAGATGGQKIPEDLLFSLLRGYERSVRRVRDPSDPAESWAALQEADEADEMRILVLDF
jgi:TPP-dependent indolepyruvate ferredoxin oxidoreductase alpha subunit